MKLLVCLAVAVACTTAQLHVFPFPYVPFPYTAYSTYSVAPVTTATTQYHAQDSLGQFTFGHAGDGQARVEAKTLDGAVRGAYSYVDPTGKLINVHYLADGNGFRVVGANNLPVAPDVPEVPTADLPVGPEPVQDTPEVIAARADFEKKYAEAAEAAAAAPEEPAEAASRRRRRDTTLPLLHPAPLVHTVHTVSALPAIKTTFKYKALEPVDAATPAHTKKLEVAEKEQQVISLPAVYSYALLKSDKEAEEEKPVAITPFGYYI